MARTGVIRGGALLGLFLGGFVGSACSPGGGGDATHSPTSAEVRSSTTGTPATASSTTTTPLSTSPPPELSTIADLEALWADKRQAIVERIVGEGHGIGPDNVLRGPAGLEVDLNRCPEGWSPTEGITDDTITIGMTTRGGGQNTSAFEGFGIGMDAYFDHVNRSGGISGRSIVREMRQDYFVEPADAVLAEGNVFAITNVGAPEALAIMDKLNEACVPQPFVSTGHPGFGDPVGHPFNTGSVFSYRTEPLLWGHWIETELADKLPVTVSAVVMDNYFGWTYEDGFRAWAEANPDVVAEFTAVRHDPAKPNLEAEIAEIAGVGADVFVAMTAGNACLLTLLEAARAGLAEPTEARFLPSVCRAPEAYLIPAGQDADRWLGVDSGLKDTTDPAWADDVYVDWVNRELEEIDLDPTVGLYGLGFGFYGWAHVEALRIADALPGGLTRPNYLLALWAMDAKHPLVHDGIRFHTNGGADGYLIEGARFHRYDAEDHTWVPLGEPVDLDGATPTCSWDGEQCR